AAVWSRAARSPLGLGPSLVDHKVPVAEQPPIEHFDGLGGLLLGGHFHESESARPTGELICHDTDRFDHPSLLEQLAEVLLGRLKRQIADKELSGHCEHPAGFWTEESACPAHRRLVVFG